MLLLDRRHIPMRTAFNLAQFALVGALSITVFSALMPASAEVGPEAWVATLAATLTGTLAAGGADRARHVAGRGAGRRGRSCARCSAPTAS